MRARGLDERQKQLQGRAFTWALGTLIGFLLMEMAAKVFIGHSLFASESLMISVPLVIVCGTLVVYLIAVDAYFWVREQGLLTVLSIAFSCCTLGSAVNLWSIGQRGLFDPIIAHGRVQLGIMPVLFLMFWLALAVVTSWKAVANHDRLILTKTRLLTIGAWVILLIVTLVVRTQKTQVHTPMLTTFENYGMMLLPLAIIWTLPQLRYRKRWLGAAWAWFVLMAWLQIWH